MKPRIVLVALMLVMSTLGSDCINDPFIVVVNLDLIEGRFRVNTGNGSFDDVSAVYNIRELIDDNFRDDLKKFRLYDIRVRVEGNHPTGTVTGTAYFRLDGGGWQQILSFSGPYSDYETSVSLLNPGTPPRVTINPEGRNILLNALNDIENLPGTIQLRGAGNGPAVTQSFFIVVEVFLQAEAEV
jgi:hypothetical protein